MKTPQIYMFGKPTNPVRSVMGADATEDEFRIYLGDVVGRLKTDPLSPHPFDRLRFSFLLLNVSRAFQQQLTRHRIDFSYSIQSLRMVNVGKFATNGAYTIPRPFSEEQSKEQFCAMFQHVEDLYNVLVEKMPTEDARGILPLNIHSPVSFSATFRAIHAMLKQRLCLSTQGEFRDVAQGIRDRIHDFNHALGAHLLPHCSPDGICKMGRPDCRKVKKGICVLPE